MTLAEMIKSHQYYLYEKYHSLLAELLSFKQIIETYKKRYQVDSSIVDAIEELRKLIEKEYQISKKLSDQTSFMEFIVQLDICKSQLENIVRHIKLIHDHILQTIVESRPHLIPHPPIQKRYSSKSLSHVLSKHHQKLINAILPDEDHGSKVYSVWSHSDNYRCKQISAKSYFNQHSFYYHDIIWSIPTIIDHEVILNAIQNNNTFKETINSIATDLKQTIKAQLNEEVNEKDTLDWKLFNKDFQDFISNNLDQILWELLADFIGYKLHGKAYLYAFLHETLGEFIGRDFFHEGHIHNHHTIASDIQRDSLLIRQLIITRLYFDSPDSGSSATIEYDYITLVYSNLTDLIGYNPTSSSQSLSSYMFKAEPSEMLDEDSKIQAQNKIATNSAAAQYWEKIMQVFFTKIYNNTIANTEFSGLLNNIAFNQIVDNNPFFKDDASISNTLWESRNTSLTSDKLPHRSLLRAYLLNLTSPDPAYILHRTYDSNHTFGFGSFSSIDIQKSEKEIEICSKIDQCIRDLSSPTSSFVNKHALLKIVSSGFNDDITSGFMVYIMVYAQQQESPSSLIDIINKISETLKDTTHTIYKSLGPEDIVIQLNLEQIDSLWSIVESLRSKHEDVIMETFTSITTHNINSIQFNSDIWIKSYYRTKTNITFDAFLIKFQDKFESMVRDKKIQIFNVTDKFYDFEVWWNIENFSVIRTFEEQIKDIFIESQHYLVSSKQFQERIRNSKARKKPKGF